MAKTYEFFRYFKGEEQNPFYGKEQNKAMLWEYERCYSFEGASDSLINEYTAYTNDSKDDGNIPIGFKALLFNRYMDGEYDIVRSIPDFKKFYETYYCS